METILLVIASLIPVGVLLWYFNKQDRGRKEPLKLRRKIFLWGVLIIIPAAIIEINIDDFFLPLIADPILQIAFGSFVTAALVEEGLKLWVVRKFVFKNKNFDEIMDGITYTILASLGFAAFENMLYVVSGGWAIAIIRAILSVPAHAMFSGIMGYHLGMSKFNSNPGRHVLKGFAYAVFYHGMFNFLLFLQNAFSLLVILLMIVMYLHLKTVIGYARFQDGAQKNKPEPVTVGRVLRILTATVIIAIGAMSFVGSIFLTEDPDQNYGTEEVLYSAVFAMIMCGIGYLILRKKKVDTKD